MSRRPLVLLLLVLCAGGLIAFAYPRDTFLRRVPADHYGWQTDAYVHGQLPLRFEPPREMLALPNPYSTANAPYYIRDLALFGGQYYAYNGVAPILVFFIPIRLLTGWFPTEDLATVVFACLAVGLLFAFVLQLRRHLAPGLSAAWMAVALVMLGWGSGLPNWIAEIGTVQLASMSGALWQAAMLWCGARALWYERPTRWVALASTCWGLSVASRPSLLLSGAALFAFAWGVERRPERSSGTGRMRTILAMLVPAAVIGLGLATLNAARFGSPFEFGLRFTLNHWGDQRELVFFSPRYLLPNLRAYLLSPVSVQSTWPYLIVGWRSPAGLIFLPYLAGVLGLQRWLRRGASMPARTIAVAVLLLLIGNALPLLFFLMHWSRYWIDFHWPFTLAATVGWMAAAPYVASRFRRSFLGLAITGAAIQAVAMIAVFLETLY